MPQLLQLIWSDGELISVNPLPNADGPKIPQKAVDLFLKVNAGKQFPKYILPENAKKYGIEIEKEVQEEKAKKKEAKVEKVEVEKVDEADKIDQNQETEKPKRTRRRRNPDTGVLE